MKNFHEKSKFEINSEFSENSKLTANSLFSRQGFQQTIFNFKVIFYNQFSRRFQLKQFEWKLFSIRKNIQHDPRMENCWIKFRSHTHTSISQRLIVSIEERPHSAASGHRVHEVLRIQVAAERSESKSSKAGFVKFGVGLEAEITVVM